MDFFAQQDKARKNTKLLVFYFILAVALIIVTVYLVSAAAFTGAKARHYARYGGTVEFALWNPQLFFFVCAGVLGVVGCGSAYKISALSSGGSAVAESLGGRLVESHTNDRDERKLLNVVEEMSLASGVPMPAVYVMDDEQGINAFAAGHSPSDAAVSVTRGCITSLTRDELQGVIGHEFSHILNGDMRMNLRLMGVIFGLVCIATIGRILLNTRSRDRNPLPLLGLLLLILGWVGVLFGHLIQAAVSRQREFLADASSVQFTRNPLGLSGALQKIGGSINGSRLESEHAQEASHMFFSNGVGSSLFGAFATHPPLDERIRAIDPSWDGTFREPKSADVEELLARKPAKAHPATMPPIVGVAIGSVLSNIGNPTMQHLRYAEELRNSIPESARLAARDSSGAAALIYALLLGGDTATRAPQLDELAKRAGDVTRYKVVALLPDVAALAQRARLPLVNIALPALKQMSAEEFKKFSDTLKWLVESDGQIDLFEFVLQKIIQRHVAPKFTGAKPAVAQFYTLKPLVPDCAVLLSALAGAGSDNDADVSSAFAKGAPYLRANDASLGLLPRDACGLDQIDTALNRLALAVPQIKKNLIEACVNVVGTDGVILEGEAELLRGICDTLDCPMPPLLAGS